MNVHAINIIKNIIFNVRFHLIHRREIQTLCMKPCHCSLAAENPCTESFVDQGTRLKESARKVVASTSPLLFFYVHNVYCETRCKKQA